MKTPVSWLRDFTPLPDDLQLLIDTCNELGFVVDGVERIGAGLDDVVVGRVIEIGPIAGADKIRRVRVDVGAGDPLEVVCGAWNFETGDDVAFIPAGGTLPDGTAITRRKMKGVTSNGMICSERELGLGTEAGGILVLADGQTPGQRLSDALGIEPDVVLDLDIETNRPDALSMAGVARDLAAKLKLPFAIPEPPAFATAGDPPVLRVESPDLSPRFTATVLTNVALGPSPAWIARRLNLAGMRAINNLVDISNYVMLELGQPTHPYDLDRVPGGGLLVRRAAPGEILVTLDGTERRLGDGDDCLICDAEGTPVGIAGVMGGASSEISDATRTVLLEAAWFNPMAIARTSKRIGLRSEASARFERGVDHGGVDRAVRRFIQLARDLTGAEVGGAADFRDEVNLPHVPPVRLRTRRVNDILGTDLGDDQIRGYLEPIGFVPTPVEAGVFDVDVPTFRPDVNAGEINLIEEVARHHGYDRVPKTRPANPRIGALTPYQRERRLVREVLAGCGISEAMTGLLVGPEDHGRAGLPETGIEADRPMLREESVLRTSLRPGLLRAVAFNATHRNDDVALFEVGHVFLRPATEQPLPDQPERVTALLAGQEAPSAVRTVRTLTDALRIADVELIADTEPGAHPGRTARVSASGQTVGVVGEIDPEVLANSDIDARVAFLDLDLERLLASPRRPVEMRPVSRFPSSDIDLAFVVSDAVPAAAVEATLRTGQLVEDVALFDVYRGPGVLDGSRSLAYRLRFRSADHTLTDSEVGAVRQTLIDAVIADHAAELRG
jgi:phenylalanyl-tRNA synthetase beta chain